MAKYIDKSAVIAEIVRKMNRCKKILLDLRTRQNKDYYQGKREAYIDILSFLDTLEVKDDMDTIHPIEDVVSNDTLSNDLEEAAKKVGQKYFPDEENIWARPNYEAKKAECAFKEGAKWGKNQAKVKIQAQSMALAHGCPKEDPSSKDLGEYINELSKQFPEVSFAKLSRIAVRVANWQKEQIIKDAIEREVKEDAGGYPYIDATELYDYDNDKPLANAGDKVKVIIMTRE